MWGYVTYTVNAEHSVQMYGDRSGHMVFIMITPVHIDEKGSSKLINEIQGARPVWSPSHQLIKKVPKGVSNC